MRLQLEYLLKKISTAMSQEWDGKLLEDLMLQDAVVREEGMSVWSFLEHMGAGRLLRVTSAEAFTLALDEVFLEMYHNVLKRVRHVFRVSSLLSCVPRQFSDSPRCFPSRDTCGKRGTCAETGPSVGSC